MTTFTKYTLVEYQETVNDVPHTLLDELLTMASQMTSDGKTDGTFTFDDLHTVRRPWVDQVAAEEWINFIVPAHSVYNIIINNISIVDATV